jgi:hypothetical protein
VKSDEQFLTEHVTDAITFDMGYGVVPYTAQIMEVIRIALRSRSPIAVAKLAYDFQSLQDVYRTMSEFELLSNAHRFGPVIIVEVLAKFYAPENFHRMTSLVEVQSSLKNLIQQVKTGAYAQAR